MKKLMLVALLVLGQHGIRHNKAGAMTYLNLKSYRVHKALREKIILDNLEVVMGD